MTDVSEEPISWLCLSCSTFLLWFTIFMAAVLLQAILTVEESLTLPVLFPYQRGGGIFILPPTVLPVRSGALPHGRIGLCSVVLASMHST